jgi:pimeloyl-ACP methyl ester carboxylesterase
MWRWTKRIVGGTIALLLLAVTIGSVSQWVLSRRDLAAATPPGRFVDVGGHRLHIWCIGTGDPAVVFDAGLGGASFGSYEAMAEVSRFSRVCAYDRAGMGFSDPGPTPRTSRRIANELAELLTRSNMSSPVVLVGTSFGGFNVRLLASEHKARVAGLVLVEASHEDQGRRYAAVGAPPAVPPYAWLVAVGARVGLLRAIGVTLGDSPEDAPVPIRPLVRATAYRTSRYLAMYSELTHAQESGDEVRASRHELSIPVVVVTGGRRSGSTASVHAELQRDLLHLSKRSCQVVAEQSGHGLEEVGIVVKAIRAVVDAAKTQMAAPICS